MDHDMPTALEQRTNEQEHWSAQLLYDNGILKTKNNESEAKILDLQKQLDQERAGNQLQKQKIINLEEELVKISGKNEQLEQENGDLMEQIEFDEASPDLEEQNINLQGRIEDLEEDNRTVRRQLMVAEQEIVALTNTNTTLRLKLRKWRVGRRILATKARELGRLSDWLSGVPDREAAEPAQQ
jgi:chromosome segregation ATPase